MADEEKKRATTKKKVGKKKAAAKKKVASKKKVAAKKKAVPKKKAAARKKAVAKRAGKPDVSLRERYEMIATMAYYRAEKRGFRPGNEMEDWLEAEQLVDKMLGRKP